jgi:hypothetical protein
MKVAKVKEDATVPAAVDMIRNLVADYATVVATAREYHEDRFREQLLDTARGPKREHLRGLAAAALYDIGERDAAARVAEELAQCKQLGALAWCALVRAAPRAPQEQALVTEASYRRLQLGWVE